MKRVKFVTSMVGALAAGLFAVVAIGSPAQAIPPGSGWIFDSHWAKQSHCRELGQAYVDAGVVARYVCEHDSPGYILWVNKS
ncbi:hypothetical protein GCM10012279_57420 [Micromonospora yangpuensis]|uniref:Secreted protein n=1 Tax=Micromonospora yangpuensis TaxID=683228 RepID=A0A1C6VFK0_9ACTN|nr:hypothetical protein GCM10012279_57420 [Micromonospora yangpuensis]SCL65121.1 hypothetical protein GA0070617_5663 [Micromonospora yangpuensis]